MLNSAKLMPDQVAESQTSLLQRRLKVAYAIQNVGGIDLTKDFGDGVPVKYTVRGLQKAGHQADLLMLFHRMVKKIDDITALDQYRPVPLGVTETRPFKFMESAVRRLQGMLRLPYFALFDSYRFYRACLHALPRYDLCHEHNGLLSIGAALACKRLGIPYVLTFSADPLLEYEMLGQPLRGLHARVAAWAARLTYQTADKIICVSRPAKQHLVETWQVAPEKICVMPNGVDVALFGQQFDVQAIRAELELGDAPVVMFVGSFQLWHGLELLVESFSEVLKRFPRARLFLVGDGPARSLVEQKAADLRIADAVMITGLIPQVDVPRFLALADVVTIPYPRLPKELWFSPLKLYEYMAARKAIVASRAGQIAEVIEDGHNGVLVEPGNVMELTQAIASLLQSSAERQRLGQNAHRQVVARHSWEHYIRRLEEIYSTVL